MLRWFCSRRSVLLALLPLCIVVSVGSASFIASYGCLSVSCAWFRSADSDLPACLTVCLSVCLSSWMFATGGGSPTRRLHRLILRVSFTANSIRRCRCCRCRVGESRVALVVVPSCHLRRRGVGTGIGSRGYDLSYFVGRGQSHMEARGTSESVSVQYTCTCDTWGSRYSPLVVVVGCYRCLSLFGIVLSGRFFSPRSVV